MDNKDLRKKLREVQEKYDAFRNFEDLNNPDVGVLYDNYPKTGISPEFKLEVRTEGPFRYHLTYNGFGDISIEDIDFLIDALKKRQEIMRELEPYIGIEQEFGD